MPTEFIIREYLDSIEVPANTYVTNFNGLAVALPGFDAVEGNVTFVANSTSLGLRGYLDTNFQVSVDGGPWEQVGSVGTNPATVVTGLSSTPHLFRIRPNGGNDYLNSVYLDNAPTSISKAKSAYLPSTSILYPESVLYLGGGYSDYEHGRALTGTYSGMVVEFRATGTDVEEIGYEGRPWAVSIDGGTEQLVMQQTLVNDNYMLMASFAHGNRTVRMVNAGGGLNTFRYAVRVLNASHMSAAGSMGATTVSVDQTDYLAVGDWVWIDYETVREWKQVASKTSNSITFATALAYAHVVGCLVCSYSAPATAISAWQSRPTPIKRLCSMGDSNTEGYNTYGDTGVPDANGVHYTLYDPRRSYGYLASRTLGYDYVNLGIQGTTSDNMALRVGGVPAFCQGGVDYVTIFPCTNDINGTNRTDSDVQVSVQAFVDGAASSLRAGGKIVLMPPGTPQNQTGGGGLTVASVATVLQAIASQTTNYTGSGPYSGQPYNMFVVYAANLLSGINLTAHNASTNPTGDLDGNLHYWPSGQDKLATNLAPYIGGSTTPTAPVITSPATATATVGTAFSYQITATNSPTSYGATGLPPGLSINTATGLITGTPQR